MSTPRTDIDEWVLASAAEVARNVARHGVLITWSETAERLRRAPSNCCPGQFSSSTTVARSLRCPSRKFPGGRRPGSQSLSPALPFTTQASPTTPRTPRVRESSSRFPGTPQLRWYICSAQPWLRGSRAPLPAATRNKLKRRGY